MQDTRVMRTFDPGAIEAVFFDVGNTLFKPYPSMEAVCREVLLRFGIDPTDEELRRGIDAADRFYESRYWTDDSFWANEEDASEMWSELYALVLEEIGVDGDYQVIGRAIYDHFGDGDRWRTYPDVVPVFETLKREGYRMALVSNWDSRLAKLCFDMGLDRYLDSVLSSASIGLIKPNPVIYQVACERLKVEPGHAVHVGDHYYADVLGSRSVGINPVMIDRFGHDNPADVPIIKDLYGLLPLLDLQL
jgi:putative hydrolase of the HAD superfamily